jgi:hypothetical protein
MYSELNTKRASETTSLLIGGVNALQTAAIAPVGEMPADTLSQAFMARSTEAYIETLKLQWRQTLIRKYPDAALLGFLIDLGALTYFIVLFCRSGWNNMPYSSLYALAFCLLLVAAAFFTDEKSRYLWMGGSISYVLANRWSNSSFLINISLTIATSSMYFLAAELNDNLGLVKVAFAVVPVAYLMIILSPIPREFDVESNLASDLVNAGFLIRFKGKYFFPSFLPPSGSRLLHFLSLFTAVGFSLFITRSLCSQTFFLLFSMFCAMNGLIFFKPSLLDSPEDLRAKDVQLLLNTEKVREINAELFLILCLVLNYLVCLNMARQSGLDSSLLRY